MKRSRLALHSIYSLLFSCLIWSPSAFSKEDRGGSLTYDIGYSFGKSGDENYSELNLGINYFFSNWFVWRNSGFHRNFSNDALEDRYGLDTSARFNFDIPMGEQSGLHLFGGPGWRFQSTGNNPPLAEAGIAIKLGGLKVGGGVKMILNEIIDKNLENETQYFFTVSGRGKFGN